MENNTNRNSNDIDDDEYTRMQKAEDCLYKYHGEEADEANNENEDDGYPEVVEHNESGSVYDLKTGFSAIFICIVWFLFTSCFYRMICSIKTREIIIQRFPRHGTKIKCWIVFRNFSVECIFICKVLFIFTDKCF